MFSLKLKMRKHMAVHKSVSINLIIYYDNAINLITNFTTIGHLYWMIMGQPFLPGWSRPCKIFDIVALFNLFYVVVNGFGVVIYR